MRLWATMINPEVDRCSKKAGFRRSSRPGAGRPDRSLRMSRPAWHARSGATHPHLTPINCRRVASFYAAAQSLSRLWSGKAPPPRCDFAGARRLKMLPWTPPPRFGNFSKSLPACRAISARTALCGTLDTQQRNTDVTSRRVLRSSRAALRADACRAAGHPERAPSPARRLRNHMPQPDRRRQRQSHWQASAALYRQALRGAPATRTTPRAPVPRREAVLLRRRRPRHCPAAVAGAHSTCDPPRHDPAALQARLAPRAPLPGRALPQRPRGTNR